MRIADMLRLRLRSLFFRNKVEQELDQELRYHLERQIEEGISAGMTPEDARYAALQSIKDIEQRKEECRDMRGLSLFDNVTQDFRYSLRQLRKNRGFAWTAIFVLALGISACVTMFRFVDAALIRPLPYRDQSRLLAVLEFSASSTPSPLSYPDFADWKRLNSVFSSIDAFALNGGFTLATAHGAEQVPGTRVSAGFFHTLGVVPALGRDFHMGEDSPAAVHPVILSYAAWQKRFGGSPDVLGKTVALNGVPNTIVGVLPRDFHFAPYGAADFWATLRGIDYECERTRACHNLSAIARLKSGVSIATASANLRSIARQLQKQYPQSNRDLDGADLKPLRDIIVGDVRPILLLLLSGAALLLLIACVNVSTLLLARSDTRRREIAVRGALGASSSRLFHQFAIEGFVLAALGGALGLLFAEWGTRFLVSIIPPEKMDSMPYLHSLRLDPPAILFTCSISLLAGVLFAAIPIAQTSLSEMVQGLKEGARASAGTAWRRLGSNLVVAEVAIAMLLMVSAGLLGNSLYLLLHVDIGFRADHLALIATSWAPASYTSDLEKVLLERKMMDRISTLPGVTSVALSTAPPVDSSWPTTSFHIAGRPNHGEINEVLDRRVSASYFVTLQAPLLRGRDFKEDEDALKPLVVVVNEAFAKKYYPGQDPIGKQLYYDWQPRSPMQIIGVVANVKEGPLEGITMPALYVPYSQHPIAWPAVLVRTSPRAAPLFPKIVEAIHGIDPFISVSGGETMTERINQSPSAYLHRSAAVLVGAFAAAAFLLSVVGLYGVVAYSVSQRTREIGIRMALGAERTTVYRLIMRDAVRLTGLGVILGLACSLAAATLLRTLLFGVRSWDVPTLAAVVAVLAFSALLASYIPARRAATVNPVQALRME